MVKKCCICKAEQSIANPNRVFHSVPKDSATQKRWLQILGKENHKNLVVCCDHFQPEDYRPLCDKPLLNSSAVPRLTTCIGIAENNEMKKFESDTESLITVTTDSSLSQVEIQNFSTSTEKSSDDIITNLKREQNECDDESTIATSPDKSLSQVEIENFNSCFEQSTDEITKNLKRKRRKSDDESPIPAKNLVILKSHGNFRREDFTNNDAWIRFVNVIEDFKKENLLLHRKNQRQSLKIETYKQCIDDLKEKRLLADSAGD